MNCPALNCCTMWFLRSGGSAALVRSGLDVALRQTPFQRNGVFTWAGSPWAGRGTLPPPLLAHSTCIRPRAGGPGECWAALAARCRASTGFAQPWLCWMQLCGFRGRFSGVALRESLREKGSAKKNGFRFPINVQVPSRENEEGMVILCCFIAAPSWVSQLKQPR